MVRAPPSARAAPAITIAIGATPTRSPAERLTACRRGAFEACQKAKNEAYDSKMDYEQWLREAKKVFTPAEYKTILMVLHPDGDRSPEKRSEAFRLFHAKKFALTGGK
jgi:hypothetical protein